MVAALTPLPVIGVPVRASTLDGIDSLLSIVQVHIISDCSAFFPMNLCFVPFFFSLLQFSILCLTRIVCGVGSIVGTSEFLRLIRKVILYLCTYCRCREGSQLQR